MGALGAMAMSDQVDQGNINLAGAVHWHLTSNHYPPHPAFMVPVCVEAIERGQDEDWDAEINLPMGCVEHKVVLTADNTDEHADCETDPVVQWRNRTDGKVRVGDVVESFRLDGFL